MQRRIVGLHQDEEGHWVIDLECSHTRHVRHDPPWRDHEWVLHPEKREAMIGMLIDCRECGSESQDGSSCKAADPSLGAP